MIANDLTDKDFTEKDRARFRAKYNEGGPNECWIWTASTYTQVSVGGERIKTYGKFHIKGHWVSAHRVGWILRNGPVPVDEKGRPMLMCHECDNMLCVNPNHLWPGTDEQNALDRAAKGRVNRTHELGAVIKAKPTQLKLQW